MGSVGHTENNDWFLVHIPKELHRMYLLCTHEPLIRKNGTVSKCEECGMTICGECGLCYPEE